MQKVITEQMRTRIEEMGFKGVLNITARSLEDRDFLTWLMVRFNPENMTLEIGGGKRIEVTEYTIKCVFDMRSEGGYPPFIPDNSTKEAITDVAARLFLDESEPKSVEIHPTKLADMIEKYHTIGDLALDEDFCTRMFFMVLNSTILTPNTSSYIRKVDAKWCQNLEDICGYNWCKIVFDNLRDTGHQWTLCRRLKKDKPPILGCSIFLIVSYCYHFPYIFMKY
jgi:hypothetical protein